MATEDLKAVALQIVNRIDSQIARSPGNLVDQDDRNGLEKITSIQIDRGEPSGIIASFKQAANQPTRLAICTGVTTGIFERLNSDYEPDYAGIFSLHEAFLGVAALRLASAAGVSRYAVNLLDNARYWVNPKAQLTKLNVLADAIHQQELDAAKENGGFDLANPVLAALKPQLNLLLAIAKPDSETLKLTASCVQKLSFY